MSRLDKPGRGSRVSGYIGAIVVNGILLYAANHLLEWQVPWITAAWSDVLWAINLTLQVSIMLNALYIAFDVGWFRHLGEAVNAAVALLATWWIYLVFPFDFGSAEAEGLTRLILIVVAVVTAIGMLVSAVAGVVDLVRSGPRRVPTGVH
jgi:hypothetical protein